MQPRGSWLIIATMVASIVVYLVPLPFDWRWFRPELPLMVLFYWVLALPQRVGVFSAMSLGLVLDLLDAIAAGSSVGALVILLNYQRLRQFDALQQTFVIGLILAVALIVVERLQNLLGFSSDGLQFLYSIPLSMLLWIPLRNLLRSFRRYYEVA
jgi:rod shape-determining protein MreD